ncbi:hypothetical protein SAMN04487948_1152 [Halogranum amylolyticum]|uniref:Uncharacterized protein n=1 Tax=Halogranum amylolyticum TaxID=660520 RepID=A0A1H8V8T6_9EURY|nr:hypothetical protein [Halogranum amylolyticum]SEP11892.1 hypothetical protein SAMN04487948_1152 [Halogranum amylolyticum]
MTENVGVLLATGLVGALVVTAIGLALLGANPGMAGKVFTPLFVMAVFVALAIHFYNAVRP